MPKGIKGYQKGHFTSEETKRKISEALKGKKVSEETKQKQSEIRKGKPTWASLHKKEMSELFKGRTSPTKGMHFSDESRKKMSQNNARYWLGKKRRIEANQGKKHWNWQGGISFEPYPSHWTDSLKESIRERDYFTCQMCGIHQIELDGFQKKLDIHHIDYQKDNLNPNNLISLCYKCHRKTNYNRDYWINYFISIYINF